MALQDLTPQLRTRLNRMERAVGWFLVLAMALLIFGFGYYIYKTAENRGWFVKKVYYRTSISSGEGIKVGDEVQLMGFPAGEVTSIIPNAPDEFYNVTVSFRIRAPHYGYILSDSTVKIASGSFLGGRYLEVTKGVRGVPTVLEDAEKNPLGILRRPYYKERTNELAKEFTNEVDFFKALNEDAKKNQSAYYTNAVAKSDYWLKPDEAPALTDRADAMLAEVQAALPGILALTNKIAAVLDNTAAATSNLNELAANMRPAASNMAVITANLREPKGSLGEWLIPTNLNAQLDSTLLNANVTITNADTNMVALAESITKTLDNLANITSNLDAQVQANSNMLSQISDIIVHSDQFVQGLKHHWLLRSAFKTPNTNAPAVRFPEPATSPRMSPRQ